MLKKPLIILICIVLAGIGLWLYLTFRTPPGVAPMGETSEIIAWLGLAGCVVSFLTAIIGLIQKIIELRAARN